MNTASHLTQRRSLAAQPSQLPVFDAGSLAYEDVVALATRLAKKGYAELGADFLAFANSPTGLSSLYGVQAKRRDRARPTVAPSPETLAALPYLAAATILLRSKTLSRIAIGKAALLIEAGKANARTEEEEPPLFMD